MREFDRKVSGSSSFSGLLRRIQSTHDGLEWSVWGIILLGLLIIGSSISGFFVKPWLSCLINLVAGGFSVWLGYKVLRKIKEIKILEVKELS